MWLYALLSTALAAPVGYWHPQDLAARSERFAEANDAAASTYEEVARRSDTFARALRDYRVALDLLGDRADPLERERLEALEKEFNRQQAVIRAFADTFVEDFDTEFSAAAERARAALGGTIEECRGTVEDGPRVPGIRPRTKPNPACKGDDLNAELARRVDTDAELKAALDEMLALEWPQLKLDVRFVSPVGGGERHVSVLGLFQEAAPDALRAIEQADDRARLPFEAAIEEGATPDQLAAKVAEARKITEQTAAKRAALAAPVLDAADRHFAKAEKKGEVPTGWCAQPQVLGGCTTHDETDPLVPRLLADKKVKKALP